jgi:hypothetical protein
MAAPGILTGGQTKELFRGSLDVEVTQGLGRSYGVFAPNPGSTSKLALNDSARKRDAEYRETMARLFLDIAPSRYEEFLRSVSPSAEPLARALLLGGEMQGAGGTGFIDFLLTEAQEQFSEKIQVVDTLTDNYVAFFSGRDPAYAGYSGYFLNTYQDDQRVWFLQAYHEILRGSRLAARNMMVNLRYDSVLVSGYMTNLSLFLDGETEITACRFTFQLLVKRYQILTPALTTPTLSPYGELAQTLPRDDARVAAVTAEQPLYPSALPAAEAASATEAANVRAALQSKNKSVEEIDNALAQSQAMGVNYSFDHRESRVVMMSEGLDRVVTTNPENQSQDGVGGASNYSGPEAIRVAPKPVERAPLPLYDPYPELWELHE